MRVADQPTDTSIVDVIAGARSPRRAPRSGPRSWSRAAGERHRHPWAHSDKCIAQTRTKWECPPGGSCQGPPPKAVACPAGIAPGATVHLIMAEDLTCSVDGVTTPCPEHDTGEVQVPPE
jgi:hypothetical protein